MQRSLRSSSWLALLVVCLPTCSRAPTWFHMPFDHARAYLYNLDDEEGASLDHSIRIIWHGELNPTVVYREGVTLTAEQVDQLRDAVTHGTNETAAMCFNPRHAFVFYDGDDQPVAWLEVCFECSDYFSSPVIEDPPNYGRIRALCVELGLPVFDDSNDYLTWKAARAAPAADAAPR